MYYANGKKDEKMKGNIFKRVEPKYILNQKEYNDIQALLNEYFEKDIYFESKIANIYYDNDNSDMLIESLEKPLFKKKIRLRSYGENDIVYLEVKEKYKGTVYKRRVKLTKDEYNDYLINKKITNSQIMKELDYYINYYHLVPYIYVAYDRLSYYATSDSEFRITFDSNLRYRLNNLEISNDKETKKYFDNNKYIMEVKSLDSLPLWFTSYLSQNKIYPKSFSKVGSIYTKERECRVC